MSSSPRCPGPVTRRMAMQVGAMGATGLGLGDLFRLRAEAALPGVPADTAVIFVWLGGGVSQLDTYDMKPDAPDDYRGPFRPINTNVPGIELSELLPLHAKIADKFTIIRSMRHRFSDHGGGSKRLLTGREPNSPTGFITDAPAVPAVVAKCRENAAVAMPASVMLGDKGRTSPDTFGLGAAYLGPAYNPFEIGGDPSAENFKVDSITLPADMQPLMEDRWRLLRAIDQVRRDVDATGSMAAMDRFNAQACELFTSQATRDAFDVSREADATRDRYGRHAWGQRCLMARRLVEAGCSFVTVAMETAPEPGGRPKGVWFNWDCHANNCDLVIDTKWRTPPYDQALTALIEDVHARGLDKKVLIVATGEFGHTPKLESNKGRPGRGHWPHAFSLLVSGGGLRMGQIVGSTDSRAAYPKERSLGPEDLWATVYRHLGIDQTRVLRDTLGRPMPILPGGRPIKELVG